MERPHNHNTLFENLLQGVNADLTHILDQVTTFQENERLIRERQAVEVDMACEEFSSVLVLFGMRCCAIEKQQALQREEEDAIRRLWVRNARLATRVLLTKHRRRFC